MTLTISLESTDYLLTTLLWSVTVHMCHMVSGVREMFTVPGSDRY